MKSLTAFIKKEILEQIRTGKLLFLFIIFVMLGIMNPAVAKLTPWLLEIMSESLAESGMIITSVTVSAMDSWVQFFKNIPIGLIAFILIESNTFTKEYQAGTLVLSLTKGLSRYKVVVSKAAVLTALWTVGYWICFAITYAYNAYFWDNSVAKNLLFAVFCWWVFGLFTVVLTVLFSTLLYSSTGVLAAVGSVVFTLYIIGMLPKIKPYLPSVLTDGNSLIVSATEANDYMAPLIITLVTATICFVVSIPIFNRKTL